MYNFCTARYKTTHGLVQVRDPGVGDHCSNASRSAPDKSLYGVETGECMPQFCIFFCSFPRCVKGVVRCGVLTGDGAKVEVVPYDLLELVIQ